MGFNCGIIGLPNVGKSTLFNAIVGTAAAAAENYPFCTIEPNVGRVPVPDERLDRIARVAGSSRSSPPSSRWSTSPGWCAAPAGARGSATAFSARSARSTRSCICCAASRRRRRRRGLGRSVARHRAGRDRAAARRHRIARAAARGADQARARRRSGRQAPAGADRGHPARAGGRATWPHARLAAEQRATLKTLQLLTTKPLLYLCNVEDAAAARGNELSAAVAARAAADGVGAVVVSAAIEAEIAALPREERLEYLHTLGLERPGLERVIVAGYRLLDLITFFTAGPKEAARGRSGAAARRRMPPGSIHSDFKRGFICAEVGAWEDFVRLGGEAAMREDGKLRQEGRGYVIQDGEVVRFRFNVRDLHRRSAWAARQAVRTEVGGFLSGASSVPRSGPGKISCASAAMREAGKLRQERRSHVVQDGAVVRSRFDGLGRARRNPSCSGRAKLMPRRRLIDVQTKEALQTDRGARAIAHSSTSTWSRLYCFSLISFDSRARLWASRALRVGEHDGLPRASRPNGTVRRGSALPAPRSR